VKGYLVALKYSDNSLYHIRGYLGHKLDQVDFPKNNHLTVNHFDKLCLISI